MTIIHDSFSERKLLFIFFPAFIDILVSKYETVPTGNVVFFISFFLPSSQICREF